ncbi:protein PXR1-like [Phaseolus vulgaris]|uniref:protein PXR1-like n=1 Tax=Phaseolus vulgaris TaxID=3885 RepID=UPI0035C9D19D
MHEYYQLQPRRVREEMKELMEKGRNFIYREKEFREKFQALVRKKEEKEKREREENERKAREEKEKRENVMIEKKNTKTSFSGVESDINNILASLENPCENVLAEKYMFGVEPKIDINVSSIENTEECLTNKEEESFMTPPESIVGKEFLKGDCNTLNSSFQLYNAHSSLQET